MKLQEFESQAEVMFGRQAEQGLFNQLRLFASEQGCRSAAVDRVWEDYIPTETDGWGDPRYSVESIVLMLQAIYHF